VYCAHAPHQRAALLRAALTFWGPVAARPLEYTALRLEPGQDIYEQLRAAAAGRSMFVISCVGSVTTVGLRCDAPPAVLQ